MVLKPLADAQTINQATVMQAADLINWDVREGVTVSADAAASPEVRRTLRSRARHEVANSSYARRILLAYATTSPC